MNQNNRSGEVQLTFAHGQLHFTVQSPVQYHLPRGTAPTTSWKRALTAVIVSACMFGIPAISRAATYTSADVVQATNAIRAQHGLSTLNTNATLTAAATAKANDMLAKQYFNHYSPSGEAPWAFFKRSGYTYTAAGENLAIDFVDGADILPAWMGSPSHRDNILNAKYQDVGIAVVDGTMNGTVTTIVVQFFGSKQAAPTVTATPKPDTTIVSKPAPTPVVVAQPVPPAATPIAATPALILAPTPVQANITVPVTPEPTAEVRGAAIRVIPTTNGTTQASAEVDPRIAILVLSTIAAYLLLLVGFATLQKAFSEHAQTANSVVLQA